MSAASLATSVPLMPMAMPMSAFFSAGASFTPSPVMATTCPSPLERLDDLQLVLGRDAGEHRCVGHGPLPARIVQAGQLAAVDGP